MRMKKLLAPMPMLAVGLLLGAAARLFDIYCQMLGAGIVLVSILSSVLLFDRLRVYDFVIDGLLVYFIFFKRIDRRESQ